MCIEAKRTCKNCNTDISHRGRAAVFCEKCAEDARRARKRREYKRRKANKKPKARACLTCNADITDRHPRARYCEKCAKDRIYQKNREWKLEEYHKKKQLKERRCIDCNADISYRGGKAIRCEKCAPIAAYIQTKIAEKKRREERRKNRPGAAIRAITPLGSELGTLCDGLEKRQKKREILPPPDLSSAKWVVKIGKTTYYPRSEKRYKELLIEKSVKES